jgi:hypothetical protein
VILSNNVTARRCPVCAERFAERVRKKYKNPPADPLTADVRKADAAGKSYGYWRLDELLKEQKAREELDNLIERNRKRKEHEQQQEKAYRRFDTLTTLYCRPCKDRRKSRQTQQHKKKKGRKNR